MSQEGSGGTSFFRCEICKKTATVKIVGRLDAIHDDGTPICLEKTETSEHLPECMKPQTEFPCKQCWEIECECTCICERLRACEERVVSDALQQARAREVNGVTWAQAWSTAGVCIAAFYDRMSDSDLDDVMSDDEKDTIAQAIRQAVQKIHP